MAHYGFTVEDHSGESSTTKVQTRAATAANFDAIVGENAAFEAAFRNLTIGTIRRDRWVAQQEEFADPIPADPYAQREMYWLVQSRDSANNPSEFTIPCPDLSDPTVLLGNTEVANLAHANFVALAAAFDGIYIHPSSGLALTIEQITLKGRR